MPWFMKYEPNIDWRRHCITHVIKPVRPLTLKEQDAKSTPIQALSLQQETPQVELMSTTVFDNYLKKSQAEKDVELFAMWCTNKERSVAYKKQRLNYVSDQETKSFRGAIDALLLE